LFALLEGRAIGPTPRESFLFDFTTYARFFLAVPLLFAAEMVVGPRLRTAALHFVRADLIRPEDLPAVDAAIGRVRRQREALVPELVILGIAFFGSWFLTVETWYGSTASTWNSITMMAGTRLSLAGLWYRFAAVPILQFLVLRWFWRLIIWTFYLRDMTRLKLNLVATHPDQAGGLGFLGNAQSSLGIFAFALGCVMSADMAFRIYFEATHIDTFWIPLAAYLVLIELVCFGPLLIFVPLLLRTRREGFLKYSILANTYNRSFEKKWVAGNALPVEPLLGSADIQSLADLGNSFKMIREMKIFPFGRHQIIQLAVTASLPGLPLIFLVMPVREILKFLAKAVL
jgi:hypothetical protein